MGSGSIYSVTNVANVPQYLKDYVRTGVTQTLALNSAIKASRYKGLYQKEMQNIDSTLRRVVTINRARFKDNGWSVTNDATYLDAAGVPYRKDGGVAVVISDRFEDFSFPKYGPPRSSIEKLNSWAIFDPVLNRVIISPVFAELTRQNRVRYLGSDGKYHLYEIKHIIHHEFGHAGDYTTPPSNNSDKKLNSSAEYVERFGQLVDGDVPRAPHGNLQFKASDGTWGEAIGDPTDPRYAKFKQTLDDVRASLGLSGASEGPSSRDRKGIDEFVLEDDKRASVFDDLVRVVDNLADKVLVIDGGQIGVALGSVLGRRLTNNPFGQILASATLSTVLGAIGEFVDTRIFNGTATSTNFLGGGV